MCGMSRELHPWDLDLRASSLGDEGSVAAAARDEAQCDAADDDLVPAELLPDPPSPFAFGIKALLLLMAIAGVQFALMSYLGPMVGLLTGIGFCIVAMAVLMVSSILLGLRPGSDLMDQMDRIAIRLVVGMVILFIGTILAGGGQMIFTVLEDTRFAWRMQCDIGFTYQQRTLYDPERGAVVNALEVTSVTTGGPLDQAGVRGGDLIVLEGTVDEFLAKMDEQRGRPVDIRLANYAAGAGQSDIDDASQRVVTVRVPD